MSEGGQGLAQWAQQVMRAGTRTLLATSQHRVVSGDIVQCLPTVVSIGGSAGAAASTAQRHWLRAAPAMLLLAVDHNDPLHEKKIQSGGSDPEHAQNCCISSSI